MARVAIAGGGRMAERHLQALLADGHDFAALIDPADAPFLLDKHPEYASVHRSSFDGLTDIDALIISTSADHREDLLREGLACGIPRFVVEKPVSQSVAEALRMQEMATAANARVVVNHGRRYCQNVASLKALEATGDLGALRVISVRMGGGAFGCVGVHWIDLCLNLMGGKPTHVACMTTEPEGPNVRGAHFHDPGASALMRFGGGRRAHIDHGDDVGIIAGADFIFEYGKVSWDIESEDWSLHGRKAQFRDRPKSNYGAPLERTTFASTPPDIVGYARAALQDALGDGEIVSGMPEAIATIEVFAACRLAAERAVVLPLPLANSDFDVTFRIP